MAEFDTIAPIYDKTRGGEERGARFATSLADLFLPAGEILEIGVGTGLVAGAMEQRGYKIVGVDVSREMLKIASTRIDETKLASVENLPYQSGRFTGAYAIWVMHMVSDLSLALREIRRVLVPGSLFVTCSVTNDPSDDPIGKIVFGLQQKLLGDEMLRDSPQKVSSVADKLGYERVSVKSVSQEFRSSPERVARTIENRGYSNLQHVSDADWVKYVTPAVDQLRALPNPKSEIRRLVSHSLCILRSV